MKIYVDCEFNSFQGELISMALVDEVGRSWYEVLPLNPPHAWVKDNVWPVLGKASIALDVFQNSLEHFLGAYDSVHIVADWPEDILHFCASLITGPGKRIDTPALTLEIRRDLDAISEVPHNALADARAIRSKAMHLVENER